MADKETRFTVNPKGEIEDDKRRLLPILASIIEAHAKMHPFSSPEFESLMEGSLMGWSSENLDFIILHVDEVIGGKELLPIVQKVFDVKRREQRERELRKEVAARALSPEQAATQMRNLEGFKRDLRRDRGLPEDPPQDDIIN